MARSRRKSKTPSAKGAFTLVELLVVIVILGLLMALLVPLLRGVWKRYNMTRCQSNLFHIYQAFRLRAADEAMDVKQAYAVKVWSTVLLPYLENDASQFFCTETAEVQSTFKPPGIDELVEWKTVGSSTWTTQFVEGTYMLKLSDTQYWAIRAMNPNYLWNEGEDNIRSKADCNFKPDGNPDVTWYCLEDHGGDWDFKDAETKVTYNGDGTITVEMMCPGSIGHKNYLMDKLTGKELALVPSYQKTPIIVSLGYGGAESSYGMNEYAIDKVDTNGKLIRGVGGAGGKILVLDYSCLVASPDNDHWNDTFFDPDESGVPLFARHFGQANVLFSDGSVRPERPADIDPITATVAMKWWEP